MAHSNLGTCENQQDACADNVQPPVKALVAGRRLRGLSWNKTHQLWRVRIYYAGKLRFVGRFQDAITAARAYDKAAVYLYGTNAVTNFGIDACLTDPAEVGSCIMRAKEEAESAATNRQGGNVAVTTEAATASWNGSSRSTSGSFSSSTNTFVLDGINAVQGANSGQHHPAAAAAAAAVAHQQQQQSVTVLALAAKPSGSAVAATAKLNRGAMPVHPSAVQGLQVDSVPLHMLDGMSMMPHNQHQHQHHQQQQQQQHFSAVTRAFSLPNSQHMASTGDITAAAGDASGLSAVHSEDQASLVHLLLNMQQQQHGYHNNHMQSSYQAADQHLLLPPAAAVATTCHQLFPQQPQVFQLTAGGNLAALSGIGSTAPEHAAVTQLQQQQQKQTLLLHQACHYQQQQQQGVNQQIQLLTLAHKQQRSFADMAYSISAAPPAAAIAAGSSGFVVTGAVGSSGGVNLVIGGNGTVAHSSSAAGQAVTSGGWPTHF